MVLDHMQDIVPDYTNTWDCDSLPRMSARDKIVSQRSVEDWVFCTLPRRKDKSIRNSHNTDPLPPPPPPPRTFEKRSPTCSMYMRYAVINQAQLRIQNSPTLQNLAEPVKKDSNRSIILKKIRPISVAACIDTFDYDSYKKLSGSQLSILSRTSISEKVEKTKQKLRRALSLDKLSSSNKDSYSFEKPKLKKSPSLRSLTGLLKKKDKDSETDGVFTKRRSASVLGLEREIDSDRHPRPQRTTVDTDVTSPTHGRKIGRLLAIKPDGTQVIELVKPPNGPFGFYIAKGTSSSGNGIFVTRLGDGHPAKMLAGLLQVGDEILQINSQDLKKKKLDDVYDLMMDNDTLVLHVRPLNSRSDYKS